MGGETFISEYHEALNDSWRRMGSPGGNLSIFEFPKDFHSRAMVSTLSILVIRTFIRTS